MVNIIIAAISIIIPAIIGFFLGKKWYDDGMEIGKIVSNLVVICLPVAGVLFALLWFLARYI